MSLCVYAIDNDVPSLATDVPPVLHANVDQASTLTLIATDDGSAITFEVRNTPRDG
jgi:hypothetical protein